MKTFKPALRNVGDRVYLDGCTSMAQQNAEIVTIGKVDWRFDEVTGEKFPIYHIGDGEWYDGRDGGCYSKKESMYYLEL
jgi:hypothetical protein